MLQVIFSSHGEKAFETLPKEIQQKEKPRPWFRWGRNTRLNGSLFAAGVFPPPILWEVNTWAKPILPAKVLNLFPVVEGELDLLACTRVVEYFTDAGKL